MGCDIHIQIERRVGDVWQVVPWSSPLKRRYSGHAIANSHGDPWGCGGPRALGIPDCFDSRNYDLFGVLANVRNGTWGAMLLPIADPRGLPIDKDSIGYLGDHSFSWVTLRELQDYPWSTLVTKTGFVDEEAAQAFEETGQTPVVYSRWSSRGRSIRWTQSIEVCVNYWNDKVLPVLATLGEPDNVRIVFGFDN